jgi:hypothetical protein
MVTIIMMVGRRVLLLSMVFRSSDFAGSEERGRCAQKSAMNLRCSARNVISLPLDLPSAS